MEHSDFAPDIQVVRDLASEITSSLQRYETAQDSDIRASALRSISQNSQKLKLAAAAPNDAFSDFTFQPLANACVRIALSMGIFDHLACGDAPLTVEELAHRANAEISLTKRVVRGLVAFGILHLDEKCRCSLTPMSQVYADKSRKSWAIWMWDVMIDSSTRIGSFFDNRALTNPIDPKNAPFTSAHDERDLSVFEIVKNQGYLPLMNSAMSGSSVICAQEAVASYKFDELAVEGDSVAVVDVGGAKGDTLKAVRRAYPALKGRLVLEELQSVLDDTSLQDSGIETQPYDFFKEDQPIQGAAAYYYQRIFHDWDDENCGKILRSLKPAMAPGSKLLICDVVVPDHDPSSRKVLRDINMLLVGGKERSQQEWHTLLEDQGFAIERIIGLHNPDNSIIEAKVK